jgi:hypothetical protein
VSRDRYERRHRRTHRHPESIAFMASADFSRVPPLEEVLMGSYDTRGGHPLHDPSADVFPPCDLCGVEAGACECSNFFQPEGAVDEARITIMQEIAAERTRQIEKWGNEFDDANQPHDWAGFIMHYTAVGITDRLGAAPGRPFREAMLKVATLAIAAIDAHDRKTA